MEQTYLKPILKWAGGKSQIINHVIKKFPKEINNYYELFVGGGSVLLNFLNEVEEKKIIVHNKIYACDINETLLNFYKNVQKCPNELYDEIMRMKSIFEECDTDSERVNRNPDSEQEAKKSKESYYYWIRKSFNNLNQYEKNTVYGSCLFLFLNKTCWRGLYREGPNGFNVPYGNYKNPSFVDKDTLLNISNLIQKVEFICCDFREITPIIQENDFVYLDPPYSEETKTSFKTYVKSGFDTNTQKILFEYCYKTCSKFLMNNSCATIVSESFSDKKFNVEKILCKRHINSKFPESTTDELIITNYE